MPKLDKPKKIASSMVSTMGKKSGTSTLFAKTKPNTRKPKKPKGY